MSDPYVIFANSGFGGWVAGTLGLPKPLALRRYEPGQAQLLGPVLALGRGGGPGPGVAQALEGLAPQIGAFETQWTQGQTYGGLVFDATEFSDLASALHLYQGFHLAIRSVVEQGRILVIGRPPELMPTAEAQALQRGLEGFVRSIAKEAKRAITVNLLYVTKEGEPALGSSLNFFLSPRSAYVSGQVVRIGAPVSEAAADVRWSGRRVLVTGAARGIGEAIARLFHREGASLTLLDVPQASAPLEALAAELDAEALGLDITAPDAAERLLQAALAGGGYDAVVHNAGITRDKTIARMSAAQWNSVMAVNLTAPLVLTQALVDGGAIRSHGSVVGVSSISGIAGNMGQSNYALSKAGLIGAIQHLSPILARQGLRINAVAPGFIETEMTASIPFAIREAGRRMNALGQGGLPVDVAETIAWLAHPASGGIQGQVVRVCGQSLLGA